MLGACLNSRGKARGGGTRRATCPRVGDGAGAAKAHGKRREGDEEDADERQRVTETSKACGRTEEEDTGEEEDKLTGTHCSSVGTARRRRKRRGPEVQREEDGEGELLGINGETRDGRSSDADDNSG